MKLKFISFIFLILLSACGVKGDVRPPADYDGTPVIMINPPQAIWTP